MTTEQDSIDQAAREYVSSFGLELFTPQYVAIRSFRAGVAAGIQAERERQFASASAELDRRNAAGARKTSGRIV